MSLPWPRLSLIATIILTFSCTKFEVGYQLAPRYISNKLDDAFDFKSKRLKEIREQLNIDFHKNHSYVATLLIKHIDEFLALADKKLVTAADFKQALASIYNSRKELMILFKPSVDIVLMNLSAEETKSMNEFSLKKFKEADEKLLERNDFIKKQVKTFQKIMDFLADDSTDEQDQIYKNFVLQNYDYFTAEEEERKIFIKKFNFLFNDKPQLATYVVNYYSGIATVQSDDYQKKHANFLLSLYSLQFKIWHSLSEKQKRAFRKNLVELREELLPVAK